MRSGKRMNHKTPILHCLHFIALSIFLISLANAEPDQNVLVPFPDGTQESFPLYLYLNEYPLENQPEGLTYNQSLIPDRQNIPTTRDVDSTLSEFSIHQQFPSLIDRFKNTQTKAIRFQQEFSPSFLNIDGSLFSNNNLSLVLLKIENTDPDRFPERAITLGCTLKKNLLGCQWWSGNHQSQKIQAGQTYHQLMATLAGQGTYSKYPLSAITGENYGFSIAIPMEPPRLSRTLLVPDRNELSIEFDFGISDSTAKFPNAVEAAFLLFPIDPKWGFRSALDRYYSWFPESFTRKAEREGLWMPFTQIDRVERPEDFYFGFHEFHSNIDIDYSNQERIYTFIYHEPVVQWLQFPQGRPRDYENFIKTLSERKDDLSSSIWNSGTFQADETFDLVYADFPWAQGARVPTNGDFEIPTTTENPINVAEYAWKQFWELYSERPDYGIVDGLYIDSFEGWEIDHLNFRREHFKTVDFPLVFSRKDRKLAIWNLFSGYDFAKEARKRLHDLDKLLMANSVMYRYPWTPAYFDVCGIETNWGVAPRVMPPPSPDLDWVRSMCAKKPYCYLQNTPFDSFRGDKVKDYIEISLSYGFYPGFFSHDAANDPYWENPDMYNADRKFFLRYLPLILRINQPGWEPLTYARAQDDRIHIERFGTLPNFFYTLRNLSDSQLTTTLSIDPKWIAEIPLQALDLFDLRLQPVMATESGSAIDLTFQPYEVKLIQLTARSKEALTQNINEITEFQEKLIQKYKRRNLIGIDISDPATSLSTQFLPFLHPEYREEWLRTVIEKQIYRETIQSIDSQVDLVPFQTPDLLTSDLLEITSHRKDSSLKTFPQYRLIHLNTGTIYSLNDLIQESLSQRTKETQTLFFDLSKILKENPDEEYFVWIETENENDFRPITVSSPVKFLSLPSHLIEYQQAILSIPISNLTLKPQKIRLGISTEKKELLLKIEPEEITLEPGKVHIEKRCFYLDPELKPTKELTSKVHLSLVTGENQTLAEETLDITLLTDRASKLRPAEVDLHTDSNYPGYTEEALNDGHIDTSRLHWSQAGWASAEGPTAHFIEAKFPSSQTIQRIIVWWCIDNGQLFSSTHYKIEYRDQDGKWIELLRKQDSTTRDHDEIFFDPVQATAIRYYQFEGGGAPDRPDLAWIRELEVF